MLTIKPYLPIAFIFSLLLSIQIQAAVKWVDDKGQTHFGDRLPKTKTGVNQAVEIANTTAINTVKNDNLNRKFRPTQRSKAANTDKNQLAASNRKSETKCQRTYGLSCEQVNNWQQHALYICKKNGGTSKCLDAKYLAIKYQPRTLAELRRVAKNTKKRSKRKTSNVNKIIYKPCNTVRKLCDR